MYSKKKENRLINLFKRDNDLGFPYHKSDNTPEQRAAFIKQLIANPKFVETYKQNNKRFEDSWREILKNLNILDYITIIFLTLGTGAFTGLISISSQTQSKVFQEHRNALTGILATMGLILGFAASIVTIISSHRVDKYSDVENFYNKLTVRLFDEMREMYPDLDENMLKHCNPEMARVIMAIMIANMPEKDTRTIQNIAIKIARKYYTMDTKNQATVLSNYNNELKTALSIVEHNLLTNSALNDTILAIYRGNIPMTFVLTNNQKTK